MHLLCTHLHENGKKNENSKKNETQKNAKKNENAKILKKKENAYFQERRRIFSRTKTQKKKRKRLRTFWENDVNLSVASTVYLNKYML